MSDKRAGFAEDIANWARGLCMGAADIVPGVSGGTMALILGHYERLVRAISRCDAHLIKLVASGQFRDAANHLDLRFLIGLALGILTGIVGLASLMHFLLEHQQAYTYAVFFGLILGSSYICARRLPRWRGAHMVLMAVGALFAWQVCVLSPVQGNLTPLTAFAAASVAICAMILPGISGAFVLLLLGLYHPITELIKGLPRGEVTLDGLILMVAFGCGCVVGLLAFSRLLKWLLATHHDATLAFLVGLMLGSLVKIWPFQSVTAATAELPFKERQFEHLWPSSVAESLPVIGLILLATVATLGLERLGSYFAQPTQRVA